MWQFRLRFIAFLVPVLFLVACSNNTKTSIPTPQPTWSQNAVAIFHSSNYQGDDGYSNAFTVPALWRISWFCLLSGDATQTFFRLDVQNAGNRSNAEGETPVRVDCAKQQQGFTIEHISGRVTLHILAGNDTIWDLYVQAPG